MIKLDIGLSPEAVAERRKYIGASDAKRIVEGDWYSLFMEKTGHSPSEDLSDNFAVALGSWTERLNLAWYEKVTGRELMESVVAHCTRFPILRATLDAWDNQESAVIEAKHVSGREPLETVVERYIPQVQHQMLCADATKAALSIIQGTKEPALVWLEFDEFWAYQYVDACKQFWRHVVDGTPPTQGAPIPVPEYVKPIRKVSMQGNNEWASYASEWLQHRDGARRFDGAAKALKTMVLADVGEASGHGIIAKRDKRGAITIKEM